MHTYIRVKQNEEFHHRAHRAHGGERRGVVSPFSPSVFSVLSVVVILILALCLTGCPTEADEGWNGPVLKVTIRLNSGDEGAQYYSLTTGKEADSHSTDWDLGFYSIDNTPSIFTNSGDTAALLGSGGDGGVWYTDKSLEDAGRDDGRAEGEYAGYVTDVERWVITMSTAGIQRMNIMTYLGYPDGNGLTKETAFTRYEVVEMGTYKGYDFDKKQFYWWYNMPPRYTLTGQTYIIKHGDGEGFSKIRVSDIYLEYHTGNIYDYVFEVQYENF